MSTDTVRKPSFDFGQVYIGCPVIVSKDPTRSDRTIGYVTAVKSDCVDVIAQYGGWNGGFRPFADCWHIDDPRCTERPAVFEDDLRGVFELAPQEVVRQKSLERLDGCERVLVALADRISAIEEQLSNMRKGRKPAAE